LDNFISGKLKNYSKNRNNPALEGFSPYLNDKYKLDGRDPNGYVGVLRTVGGFHDRSWFERSVYGKVRYINADGLRKKYDADAYIKIVQSFS